MFIQLLADLRFVIGLFFAIISGILLAVGTFDPPASPEPNLNLMVGAFMAAFAAFMLGVSIWSRRK